MADITMCKGLGCPIKEICGRFTEDPGMMQSYFAYAPYEVINNKVECKYFMGDGNSLKLKPIIREKKN